MAQAECITTAIRELMSRGLPPRSTSPVRAAHTEFLVALADNPPRPIRLEVESLDLDDRAEHVEKMLAAVHVYLSTILADTAENIPGGKAATSPPALTQAKEVIPWPRLSTLLRQSAS